MADYRYRIPTGAGRAELREKSSRFLAVIQPVIDEAAVRERLEAVRREFPDATHHCWARRLGKPAVERASDDGEPSGTAGAPMLQVLRGAELSDVLGVVVRWFGGTKLGKGGLARAYGAAVRAALEELPMGERFVYEAFKVEVPYDRLGAVQRLVHPPEVELVAPEYAATARCTLRVLPSHRASVLESLAAIGALVERQDT